MFFNFVFIQKWWEDCLTIEDKEKCLKNQTVQLFLTKKASTYCNILQNAHTHTART